MDAPIDAEYIAELRHWAATTDELCRLIGINGTRMALFPQDVLDYPDDAALVKSLKERAALPRV